MAIFKGGAGGVLSGMLGPVVVVTSKSGKVYLRQAPRKHKFSEKQQQNWKRFSAVSAFWKTFEGTPVQQIWKVAEEGRRGINLFINANAPAFSLSGELVEPERLHFSAGQLPLPYKLSVEQIPDQLKITWENNNGNNLTQTSDELMVITNSGNEFKGPIKTGITRKEGTAMIDLEGGTKGVYLFFGSDKRNLYSDDVFVKVEM